MKSKLAIKICRLRAFFLFCYHARPRWVSMSHEKRFMLAQTVAKYTGAPVDVVLEEAGRLEVRVTSFTGFLEIASRVNVSMSCRRAPCSGRTPLKLAFIIYGRDSAFLRARQTFVPFHL